jgi:uncharacterized protein (DUF1330 family)
MPKATILVIGRFQPGYQEVFPDYSKKVRGFLKSKGATVVRRQLVQRTLYGNLSPSLVMVIDFPTEEVAATAFFEQEYLDIIPLRDKVFSEFHMFLTQDGEI